MAGRLLAQLMQGGCGAQVLYEGDGPDLAAHLDADRGGGGVKRRSDHPVNGPMKDVHLGKLALGCTSRIKSRAVCLHACCIQAAVIKRVKLEVKSCMTVCWSLLRTAAATQSRCGRGCWGLKRQWQMSWDVLAVCRWLQDSSCHLLQAAEVCSEGANQGDRDVKVFVPLHRHPAINLREHTQCTGEMKLLLGCTLALRQQGTFFLTGPCAFLYALSV